MLRTLQCVAFGGFSRSVICTTCLIFSAASPTVKLQHGLNAVSNVKLPHDARHVMLYRSLSAFAASRDLFVGHAPRHKREDFLLAGSKIMGIVDDFDPLALLDQHPRPEVPLHLGAASKDGLHRLDHL